MAGGVQLGGRSQRDPSLEICRQRKHCFPGTVHCVWYALHYCAPSCVSVAVLASKFKYSQPFSTSHGVAWLVSCTWPRHPRPPCSSRALNTHYQIIVNMSCIVCERAVRTNHIISDFLLTFYCYLNVGYTWLFETHSCSLWPELVLILTAQCKLWSQ